MDNILESEFVKTYVKKEYQDRISFELRSKAKREKARSRFSHDSKTILKATFSEYLISNVKKYLCSFCDFNDECYIISWDQNDGKTIPLYEAIDHCINSYMSFIIISKKFVLVKEEVSNGTPSIYIAKSES